MLEEWFNNFQSTSNIIGLPYIISNGERFRPEVTVLRYAYAIMGNDSSQFSCSVVKSRKALLIVAPNISAGCIACGLYGAEKH